MSSVSPTFPIVHSSILGNEQAQLKIDRHVVGLLASAPLSSAATDPPIIAQAYRTVINSVAGNADLPPFTTFSTAIANLSAVYTTLKSERQRATTPPPYKTINTSSISPSPLLDALIDSPQTSTAKKNTSSLAQAVGIPWGRLPPICSKILSQVAGDNTEELYDTIKKLFGSG